ncbi:DegQ family serine endoprotease [Denitrobaculum tricleocarpae]|uniref:DegQ family serine endoprotease n=1 Tax=Denitrobaculum tricleocarpae TaxID=2591009 RepID=UPI0015D31934|nr:DegQ family serine endoprotease [Denitrobaculum tricleocarpae]
MKPRHILSPSCCKAFVVALALLVGSLQASLSWAQTDSTAAGARVPSSEGEIKLSFAPVVKATAPAVVNIFSKRQVTQQRRPSLFDDPFFKRFFGEQFGGQRKRERMESSLGSGVIVSEDGLIVTNHHVINGATEIKVVLSDRREFPAELILDDERTDLAVLRVDPEGARLPTIPLRDSDDVEVGDLILAIGNPFGVGQTVTSGIVSALARTQVGIGDFSFFIQTDAAINPGNSGGALVTMDGQLLGINTAIYSRSGGSVGIGFAIPANMVRTVIDSAKNGGALVRAWTGITGQTLTSDLAMGFGLDRAGGVVVSQLYGGGPADRAGLKPGDVILAVDGVEIQDYESLRFRVATRGLGEQVPIEVWRGRQNLALNLPIEAAPESPPREVVRLRGQHPLAGAQVANLSPALAEELDLPGAWAGVIITKIARGSTAQRIRMRPGDVLLGVNDRSIAEVADIDGALASSQSRWRIRFSRGGKVRSIDIGR